MSSSLIIALSMRIVDSSEYLEPRDALAHDWFNLMNNLGSIPICIPNNTKDVESLLKMVD